MAQSSDSPTSALLRLLSLARDLLQAPALKSIFECIGPAVQDLFQPDEALLALDLGDRTLLMALDREGQLQRADPASALAGRARQSLRDRSPRRLPVFDIELAAGESTASRQASLLALPFPGEQPAGVLALLWYRPGEGTRLAEAEALLRQLGELTGAALANIDSRFALEERLLARTEEAQEASRDHARELLRRDDLEKAIDRAALTDELTGMLNRHGFFLHAEQCFKLARRQGKACAVIFADLDGLQAINAELGHQFGERLIQAGAQVLHRSFRDSDIVARLGADAFAVLTVDAEQSEAILARIRDNTLNFHRQQASTPYRVSFSTDVVRCDPDANMSLSDYLSLACLRQGAAKKDVAA